MDYGHIFRRAADRCGLQGVYALQQDRSRAASHCAGRLRVQGRRRPTTPSGFIDLVWNQNIAPFLIIVSQKAVRLYSGFRYAKPGTEADPERSGLLRAAETIEEAMSFLDSFRADQIDNGSVWDEWGKEHQSGDAGRLELACEAERPRRLATGQRACEPRSSHGLIGKFVYLYYLRHRNILSDRKLAKWGLEKQRFSADTPRSRPSGRSSISSTSGSTARRSRWTAPTIPELKANQLRKSPAPSQATTRDLGSSPSISERMTSRSSPSRPSRSSMSNSSTPPPKVLRRARTSGAFYTPIPLVNFMLEELDSLHPFEKGMKVLDPSCGSGAFLVQCYRRIIEQDEEFVPGQPMRPSRLRDLLQVHIFGIDRDGDACRVAELSLSLTLLDYVDPPDLEPAPNSTKFRLPNLHGSNIFEGDFFDQDA